MTSGYVVARVDEIPPGTHKFVSVGKFGIAVYNVNGEFRAVTNYCPHRGGPLCVGKRYPIVESSEPYDIKVSGTDEILRCPWHGLEFDLRDGQAEVGKLRVRMHQVRVENDQIVLQGV
ncbi:Rieske (2Fe-2S) protein [Rhizobium tropici]|uniref:Rieske (2Fe-2S) protein n=1 Tax=Rhizobium tropici TaxID=398 RepID=A0A5B0VQT5_RHITR|nr:Rieske (2Fe-2S) protein [Rhizobium tropici]